MRTPSSGPTRTSVDKPRTVEVTGAAITAFNSLPIGSRVSTTRGRILSRRASHTSPRCGTGSLTGRRRNTAVGGEVAAKSLRANNAIESEIDDFGGRGRTYERPRSISLRAIERDGHLLLSHTLYT